MRISKENAKAIAIKVAEPLQRKIKEAEQALSETFTGYVEKSIPAEVMKCFTKHPEYISSTNSMYPSGVGISNYKYIGLTKQLPYIQSKFDVTPAQAKTLVRLKDKVQSAKDLYNEKVSKIENAIIALGTHNRIIENLPELEQYLPKKQSTALMIPVEDVKKDIKALQQQAAEKV